MRPHLLALIAAVADLVAAGMLYVAGLHIFALFMVVVAGVGVGLAVVLWRRVQ